MKLFEDQYKQALIEIEERIKTTKDKNLLFQLKKDKKYILNYFYPELIKKNNEFDFQLNIIESNEEINKIITNNQLYFLPLFSASFIKKNDKKMEMLFNSFIEEDEFGLKKIYDEIVLNNGLIYTETKSNYSGCNIFIPSIKRNFIEIKKSKKLYEVNSKVHELGHAKINIESYKIPYKISNNSFLESYSIFLEMVFADYLKSHGKRKEGYQLKFLVFDRIKSLTKQLYEDLEEYKKINQTTKPVKYFFEMNFKSLKGYYLALNFYFLYKSNPKESLKIINSFIKEVKLLDEKELIKKFNLNEMCFNKKVVYKLYTKLKDEKIKIKQK